MKKTRHAFMVVGTQSGCGKTTLTLALIAALKDRGFTVQPFKVGPDFIDPGLHRSLAGLESRNLDGWMLGKEYSRELFDRCSEGADVCIVEGVMGLFDGYDGKTESGSSAEMAKWLDIPVVLVIDARSMARSAAAVVHGFKSFDPEVRFAGVIFNRIGGNVHLEYLKEALQSSPSDLTVLGGVPREVRIALPERHLGLVTAEESPMTQDCVAALIRIAADHIDMDLLLEQSRMPAVSSATGSIPRREACPPRSGRTLIAVPRDAAFCFYYPDNFELLECFGADLRFFSPLRGDPLPSGISGIYLGGGYPELFARELSSCHAFLQGLRHQVASGMPVYAECGGLMTLGRFIETLDGSRYPMAGLLPFGTRMLDRRKALGYTEVLLKKPCLLGEPGTIVRGHEFHYSEIVETEAAHPMECVYELHKRKFSPPRPEGYRVGSVLASYVHLHWGSAPGAAASFVKHCARLGAPSNGLEDEKRDKASGK